MLNPNRNILFKATILALCVISLVHVFFFPIYESRGLAPRTYGDLEQSLCTNNIKRRKIWRLSRCPQDGIVTIMQGGRLGNQMWEYASVWAVARRTGLDPYMPRCVKLKLDQIFEQLTVPAFEEIAHCPIEFNTFVKSIEEWTFTNQSIILPRYTLQPELVLTWVQDIVQEFRFRKKLREKAQQTLLTFARKLPPRNYTFIGVHVRRTDYIGYLQRKYNSTPVKPQFFQNAMAYYKRKYPNCLYIFLSDDPGWCFKEFGKRRDVYVASYKSKNTPAVDMAIMAACNHTIFDYGTFGEWGSILAGGEVVYNNMTQNIKKGTGRILKNWVFMD
ncbi:galactoside 2-alpha-L-fucosyltransferase SEC1-like [Anthonomus grandis grandis]|uniref:galactoside 2-alpha-L-fucosyltransferase SEC1-like n=1 Tax=Anthonomus grandis grandis TaxID=2921223 RepID=UPI0021668ABD|nr:galactoside 2-alpha-L-fucosyltransferase SEC1-like [Anthonomus grandis grandis]XP_050294032.1 galactoside 2-alpha-L-fucosyltransferase SEC1-like [Anthonomus grandis grandis]